MKKIIPIGGDHAGFSCKIELIKHLEASGYEIKDFGTYSEESTDYPDYAHPLSTAVENGEYDLGVLVCGSGNGVCMSANKHQGIRAALVWNEELASLSREHNDANVVCIPARFVSVEEAIKMVDKFLATDFEGGRHQKRVNKISC